VEVASVAGDLMAVRDGKNPSYPVFRFTSTEWHAFLRGIKGCEFNGRVTALRGHASEKWDGSASPATHG
jgi:hypothetical protein